MLNWNYKNLGKANIWFAMMTGMMGMIISLLMSGELHHSGIQIFDKISKIMYKKEDDLIDKTKYLYNTAMTTHGMIMMFYMLMPLLMNGFGNLLMPELVGAKNLAVPKAGVMSFLILMLSFMFAMISLLVKVTLNDYKPATGWILYPPLFNGNYYNGKSMNFMIMAIILACISYMITAINLMATMICKSTEKMNMIEMSMLVWSELLLSLVMVIIMPVLMSILIMLLSDSMLKTTFYEPKAGKNTTLFQKLFWTFWHSEMMYMLMLPVFGLISEMMSKFSMKAAFKNMGMFITMAIMIMMGLVAWLRYMYSMAMSLSLKSIKYFMAVMATVMVVVIPMGIKLFSWLFRLFPFWKGKILLSSPMIWALGFMVLFVTGGMTGMQLSNKSLLSSLLSDTYYVVAHFHYVLAISVLFASMSAWYYWFYKIIGSTYNEKLCILHAIITFMATNITFLPQYFLGLSGMPSSCMDYMKPYHGWNQMSSYGAYLGIVSVVLFFYIMLESKYKNRLCPKDPWKIYTTKNSKF